MCLLSQEMGRLSWGLGPHEIFLGLVSILDLRRESRESPTPTCTPTSTHLSDPIRPGSPSHFGRRPSDPEQCALGKGEAEDPSSYHGASGRCRPTTTCSHV